MPNHVHGIIWLVEQNPVGARCHRAPTRTHEQFGKPIPGSIPTIVQSYKSAVARRINKVQNSSGVPIWQRNYYEHIIRDQRDLEKTQKYILANPLNWSSDQDNPVNYEPKFKSGL